MGDGDNKECEMENHDTAKNTKESAHKKDVVMGDGDNKDVLNDMDTGDKNDVLMDAIFGDKSNEVGVAELNVEKRDASVVAVNKLLKRARTKAMLRASNYAYSTGIMDKHSQDAQRLDVQSAGGLRKVVVSV
eukprot:9275369-Karenia_brevis.AAC.1